MQYYYFNREITQLFNQQQLNLIQDQTHYLSFIQRAYSKEAFQHQVKAKKEVFNSNQRQLLANYFDRKYKDLELKDITRKQLNLIADQNTFTVTTGHQLSLFTGHLFFIYKILNTIKLADTLKKEYPEYNFVPIYWLASEDHDFEEIKSTKIFNEDFEWNHEENGAVGRFDLMGLEELKLKFKHLFKPENQFEILNLMDQFSGVNYADAFFKFIHLLFEDFGLLCIDGDDVELKGSFLPVMEKEIKENFSFKAIQKTNLELDKIGIKQQIHPREINLFYLNKNERTRILHRESDFFIEHKGVFKPQELIDLMRNEPENFSPNVALRPLYQEFILPNLCYIGGLGEISYWLQLKGVFDQAGVLYPLVNVRNSLLYIDESNAKKMEKLEIHVEDIFMDTQKLISKYVVNKAKTEEIFVNANEIFEDLKNKISEIIDSNANDLIATKEAELKKMEKSFELLKQKYFKNEKSKHDSIIKSIESIKIKLFPNNSFQERTVNFFSLIPDGRVADKLKQFYNAIQPFGSDYVVMKETISVK